MGIITANEAWRTILHRIEESGDEAGPRNMRTKEILFNDITFDMNSPICYHQDRRLNYAFSAAEALFIANGDNRVANLTQYNKNMAQFSDDGLIFNGAYGPPFNFQLEYAVNKLVHDIESRQAVIQIWKPNPVRSRDIMCTLSLQFLVRKGALHTKVTMRSSDAWLGIPYDFFNFTIMSLRVLTLLNDARFSRKLPLVGLGTMNWSAGSSHMYESAMTDAYTRVLEDAPDKGVYDAPARALWDWAFIVESLTACMNKDETAMADRDLWRIRP